MDEEIKKLAEGFEHAGAIIDDIEFLRKANAVELQRRHILRMTASFEQLLTLALKVVNREDDALEELESFLR